MNTLLVMTNMPDRATAETLAAALVEGRFAACVNILQPCRSLYRWEGSIETADEVPMLIKTSAERYPDLEAAIRAQHPYAIPEIIAVPVTFGWPDYLAWVGTETQIEKQNRISS
jgi:periplasmic divalent cation tolerance protein